MFRTFLRSNFGTDADDIFESDFNGFQIARDAAISVTYASDEDGLNSLLFIIYQLKRMAPRLSDYEAEMSISFNYYDAFKPSKKIVCKTFYHDLCVFLWNYAALHSHIGSRVDRTTNEGIKIAQKHYQQSAGALDCIKDNYVNHMEDDVTTDFGPINADVLSMCKELMLAQAQLCFYEKAVKERKTGLMKPGIIAKLAAQTAAFYQTVVDLSKIGICGTYVDASWNVHANFQSKCFVGAAEYWKAQSAKEIADLRGSGYGAEITRLIRSENALKDALKYANNNKLKDAVTTGPNNLLKTIVNAKNNAIHDNETVYMENVPADGSLSPVGAVSLVKPSNPPKYKGVPQLKINSVVCYVQNNFLKEYLIFYDIQFFI